MAKLRGGSLALSVLVNPLEVTFTRSERLVAPCADRGEARNLEVMDGKWIDGRYQVRRVLSTGAGSALYLAEDVQRGREVMLRVFDPTLDPDARGRLERAVTALRDMRSGELVTVFGSGVSRGAYYLVLEHVDGPSLAGVLEDRRGAGVTIPVRDTMRILDGIAQGLASLHARGVAGIDLDAGNIVLERDTGRPVLCGAFASGSGEGAAGDVRTLACLAFEMLSGEPRGEGTKRLSNVRPELRVFDAVLERAFAERVEERPLTPAILVSELAIAARWLERPPAATPDDSATTARVLVLAADPTTRAVLTREAIHALEGDERPLVVEGFRDGAGLVAKLGSGEAASIILVDETIGEGALDLVTKLRRTSRGVDARIVLVTLEP